MDLIHIAACEDKLEIVNLVLLVVDKSLSSVDARPVEGHPPSPSSPPSACRFSPRPLVLVALILSQNLN